MDFGFGVFDGGPRWLEIGVRSNGLIADFATLSPRQAILPTPYAHWSANASQAVTVSGTVPSSGLNGLYSNPVSFNNPANGFTGDGGGLNNVNAAQLGGRTAAQFWQTGGNTGVNPGNGEFLGTTDKLPLELRVNSSRVVRIEPGVSSPNWIGGSAANSISNSLGGGFIGGGGEGPYPNRVEADFGAVLGGFGNVVRGVSSTAFGNQCQALGPNSTAFGSSCRATNDYAVAMGGATTAGGHASTAMGLNTLATNFASTAMGGYSQARGAYSTAMGAVTRAGGFAATAMGNGTIASGDNSTALGYDAQATHSGSFVWADASLFAPPFTSTTSNQFAVRASGGFYLQGNLSIGRPADVPLSVWSGQASGFFISTNSAIGSFFVLQNNTPSPDYLGAVFFQDSSSLVQGEIGYLTHSGGQMRFRVGAADRMSLSASGLTVNSAGGPQAYLGGDGAGGDVQLGSATAGNEAVALWNSADGDYMDLFARSGTFRGNVGFGADTRQMINLWNTAYGIGVQANAAYFRTDNEFLWFKGGSHTNVFGDPGPGGTQIMRLGNTGNLVIAGTLSQGSDRAIKQDFAALDGREVLEKVAALPIQSWSYTNQPGVKHYGPTAQDFHAAFGLNGEDDKHIATVDTDGVALAAIQGLNQKLQQKETEITELRQRLERMERLLNHNFPNQHP
jgi:hypothetical protein